MPSRPSIFDEIADTDTLGSRISRAREANDVSIGEIAKTLGVKRSTIQGWENDSAAPRAHHLIRIAGMVGVSPTWLLGGIGEAPDVDGVSDEVKLIRKQLEQIKEMRDQTSRAIGNIEIALERLTKKDAR
ncbi:MAG: helix-turn-helix transcriptional regulator [Salaquimonas sp.]